MRVNSIKLFKSFENDLLNFVKILPNSVSKFSIHPLQQRCHTVLLVSFFTTNLKQITLLYTTEACTIYYRSGNLHDH